jgi:Tfp pilus assembly protein PilN
MLRGNLSTRPFYNERAVSLVLLAFGIVVAAVTLFNVSRLVTFGGRHSELRARAETAERRATELRREAARARASVDQASLERVMRSAREANLLIDRRTFSWTDLFNRLEATLPTDVRVTAIDPVVREGRFVVQMTVAARSVEQIDAFIEALEKDGGFAEVLAREERANEEGQIDGELEGIYLPGRGVATATARGAAR